MIPLAFGLGAGFVASNFIWQALAGRDWGKATERSFFQLLSLVAYVVALEVLLRVEP